MWLAGLTILKKETCLSISSAYGGDPAVALRLRNTADYRLPPFLIAVNNKSDFSGWFDNSEKKRRVWAVRALAGVIPRLHPTSGTLQTTAYLLFDHMAPNLGILDFNE